MEKRINIINAVLMSCFMALIMSGFLTLINIGFGLEWLKAWAKGFALAWPLALFLVLLTGQKIRKLSVALATRGQSQ